MIISYRQHQQRDKMTLRRHLSPVFDKSLIEEGLYLDDIRHGVLVVLVLLLFTCWLSFYRACTNTAGNVSGC